MFTELEKAFIKAPSENADLSASVVALEASVAAVELSVDAVVDDLADLDARVVVLENAV